MTILEQFNKKHLELGTKAFLKYIRKDPKAIRIVTSKIIPGIGFIYLDNNKYTIYISTHEEDMSFKYKDFTEYFTKYPIDLTTRETHE